MCAKKKAAPNRTWKLAGEALRSTPLRVEERERIAREFSDYEGFIRQKLALGESCVTFSESKVIEGAAMAVSAYLCDHFAGRYERGAIIAAVSTTAAIPAKLSARIGKLPTFLMGAALWLLDYLDEGCEDPEDYLSLLPQETDIIMDYSMPFADDLSHSRETILRMLTVLNGREGDYRKNFRALLEMIDEDTAIQLRGMFRDSLVDYMDRALRVCQLLGIAPWEPAPPPDFSNPFDPLGDYQDDEHPSFRFLLMAPELICRPVSSIRTILHSRKAAELVSGYAANDPYALCMAFLLLEKEKDVLTSLNGLTSVVLVCAMRHLPWAEDDLGARIGLCEEGVPDYKLQYVYGEQPGEEGERLESEWLLSEVQLFYIATGVVPPRKQVPSGELVRWFMEQGIAEHRARELACAALYALHAEVPADKWEDEDWPPEEAGGEESKVLPEEEVEPPPDALDAQALLNQVEQLTQKVKELRSGLHDAERTSIRLREQLRETEQRGEVDRSELAQLREILYSLRAGEEEAEESSDPLVELPWQVKRRVVVFGGHDSWRKAVKPLLPGARFYDREVLPDLNAIRGADVVWLQVNALSHKYYYRIIDAARKNGIQVRYFGSASAKKCAVQLALDELAAEKSAAV